MKRMALVKGSLAVGLLAAAGAATAGGLAADRGYRTCVDDLEDAYPRHAALVHARSYFFAPEDMAFYVNSTAWEEGDRVALRTFCTTDRFGRHLTSRETNYGRWVDQETTVTVQEVTGR